MNARILVALGIGLFSITAARTAAAQSSCGCRITLTRSMNVVNGRMLGVMPGDVVCVEAGARPYLRLSEFVGEEGRPVIIRNCGGVVEISNPDRGYGITVDQSRHFRLTGTGQDGVTYGFRVNPTARTPYASMGISLGGLSTNYEVDHMEVFGTGFAGIMSKTDPGAAQCNAPERAIYDAFVQRNVSIHHNYIHNTGGEGFYIGSTQYPTHRVTCADNSIQMIPPHRLDGISVTDNIIEDTEWDGMQVGMAERGCVIARNQIRRVGLANVMYQTQGIQVGTLSSCDVHDNFASDGPANGIIVLGSGSLRAWNNVLVNFAADGIYANSRDTVPGVSYRFYHNTIVNNGGSGITMFGAMTTGSEAINNLIAGPGVGVQASRDVPWMMANNVVVANAGAAGFVGASDFHLRSDSPARGAGRALTDAYLRNDRDGIPRATPPSVGAYEYNDGTVAVPDASAPTDSAVLTDSGIRNDSGIPNSDAATSSDAAPDGGMTVRMGGCGCSIPGQTQSSQAWRLLAAALALGTLRRRRAT